MKQEPGLAIRVSAGWPTGVELGSRNKNSPGNIARHVKGSNGWASRSIWRRVVSHGRDINPVVNFLTFRYLGSMKSIPLLLLIAVLTSCDTGAQDTKQEINDQVWSPFIQAYAALDANAFMDVHTKDVIRVVRDAGEIKVGQEYAKSMQESANRNQERGTRRSISFSFLERIHTNNYAFEVGYYKVESASGGQQYVSYGKFHVVLKKHRGQWKILVDSDSSLNNSITEEDFMQGEVLTY